MIRAAAPRRGLRATARGRVRIVAIVLYLVLAVMFAAASLSYASDNAALRRDGVATTGAVVAFTYSGGRVQFVDGYVVSYTAPGETSAREGEVPLGDEDPVLALGDRVDLMVNPAEPDDLARLDSGPDDTLLWVTRVLTVLALLGAVAAATGRAPRLWGGSFFPDEPAHPARQ